METVMAVFDQKEEKDRMKDERARISLIEQSVLASIAKSMEYLQQQSTGPQNGFTAPMLNDSFLSLDLQAEVIQPQTPPARHPIRIRLSLQHSVGVGSSRIRRAPPALGRRRRDCAWGN